MEGVEEEYYQYLPYRLENCCFIASGVMKHIFFEWETDDMFFLCHRTVVASRK